MRLIEQRAIPFLAGFCFAFVFVSHHHELLHSMEMDSSDYDEHALTYEHESAEQQSLSRAISGDEKRLDTELLEEEGDGILSDRIHTKNDSKTHQIPSAIQEVSKELPRYDPNSVCSIFNTIGNDSAMYTWKNHLGSILNASRHPADNEKEFLWHDFTVELLDLMTNSNRLLRGVKHLPVQYWDRVGDILTLAVKRYRHLEQVNGQVNAVHETKANGGFAGGDDDELDKVEVPRKINILIMGGSVTMGVLCSQNPVEETSRFARRDCAWPNRLSQFLNALLPHSLVNVNVVTLGGTNTASASTIWDYSLYNGPVPDIIIHGYSTNDMHVLTVQDALLKNITLADEIFNVNQHFVRTVLAKNKQTITIQSKKGTESCHTKAPLLLYYDDYIGNEQKGILDTMAFSNSIETLSSYYGFGVISYPAAVRDLVYGDSEESWFSPHGWPERQIHPGMGMHITSMWLVAYYFLTVASTYCNSISNDNLAANEDYPNHGLPKLRNGKIMTGRPKPLPQNLPPILNSNLTLDNISSKWRAGEVSSPSSSSNRQPNVPTCNDDHHVSKNGATPCSFSWVAGLERFLDKPKHLDKRMAPFVKENQGWKSTDDGNKLGYSASGGVGSEFTMEFVNLEQRVVTLTFMVMTSYGEKWEGSTIHVDVIVVTNEQEERIVGSTDIVGFHEKHTSETYIHKIDLSAEDTEGAQIGHTLKVKTRLVKGDTFKITGLVFCDTRVF